MEIGILEYKIKSYLQKDNGPNKIIQPEKKRIKTASFTKILKNKIFKGYERIKYIQNKNFNINKFLKGKPEEKYLPTDAKYNIYYDYKYLNKYKPMSKKDSFLLQNISVSTKNNPKKIKYFKNKSSGDLFLTENKNIKYLKRNKFKKPLFFEKDNNKSNINDSSKIFSNNIENNLYSKYPFIYLEKTPDDIINPTDMRNYPHYIPKYRDKNRNQQYFLYNLSHLEDKKIKNIYHSLTPRIPINNNSKNKIIEKEISESQFLLALSPDIKKEYNNLKYNFYINSIDNNKIKKLLYKRIYKIPIEYSKYNIRDYKFIVYNN